MFDMKKQCRSLLSPVEDEQEAWNFKHVLAGENILINVLKALNTSFWYALKNANEFTCEK